MSGNRVKEEVIIPAYEGRAVLVPKGHYLCIIDVEGQQVGDFVCFNRDNSGEYVSPVHMRSSLSSIRLKEGDGLFSNYRRPLMTLVKDTVGKHDFFFPACDYYRYKIDFDIEDHPNCHDNLEKALQSLRFNYDTLPDPINWFMNNVLDEAGDYVIEPPLSKPGDYVMLQAMVDVVIAVSACSQDLAPVNGWKVTPLKLQVLEES